MRGFLELYPRESFGSQPRRLIRKGRLSLRLQENNPSLEIRSSCNLLASCYDERFPRLLHHGGAAMKLVRYFLCLILAGVSTLSAQESKSTLPNLEELQQMTRRFAPTPLKVNTSNLSSGDRKALVKLLEAGRLLNHVFMQQYWSRDVELYAQLQKDKSSLGKARLHYFWLNKGPWSDIDEYKAFVPDVPARKLKGANFYPEDMSQQDFERWVATLSPQEQEQAKGFFTVIRKGTGSAQFVVIPYNQEYKDDLSKAAALLHQAADLTDNASLKKFLTLRADAFLSNDYYE